MGYFYIFGTIFFTVYGQIILKWRINGTNPFPEDFGDKVLFLVRLLLDPWVLSGFLAAFVASFFWMAAMKSFDLSFAYPFMSLAFVLVLFFSWLFFNETLNPNKIIGTIVIVTGILIISRGV